MKASDIREGMIVHIPKHAKYGIARRKDTVSPHWFVEGVEGLTWHDPAELEECKDAYIAAQVKRLFIVIDNL